ncbi:hypothetical protein [Pseudoalteromonas xiamenensis]|uniref:Uncharacterized protein n=1 Tax=Pseudoalteromonas xiamenensis TaxID=882626 RepID=A0A975HLW8_9GAMM|nr:hypothetical protein [Pseudoalteromonas xiamenensis]QTH72536.1 hypothetical protein J5O05_06925 [Pseudoalteromonas xiamenensis]
MLKVNVYFEQIEDALEERQNPDRRKRQIPISPEQERRRSQRRKKTSTMNMRSLFA